MANNGEQFEALLAGYIEGELDARQRAAVERYLAANPQQRQLIQRMSELRTALRELPREPAPADLREDVQGQLERTMLLGEAIEDEVAALEMRIDRWSQLRAAAAIALLVAGVAAAIYWALPDEKQRPDAVAIAPLDAPRIEEADDALSRRDGETLAGGMSHNRIVGTAGELPPAPGDPSAPAGSGGSPVESNPAPIDAAAPAGSAETPADHAERSLAGRDGESVVPATTDARLEVAGSGWLPLDLSDPLLPDLAAIEAASADPLLPAASVLAESTSADVLVMVCTEDVKLANSAVETFFGANGIVFKSLPPPLELEVQQKARRATPRQMPSSQPRPLDEPAALRVPGTTQPADETPAAAIAEADNESMTADVDERVVRACRELADDQVLLARAVTRQQAVELGKSLVGEAKESGQRSSAPMVRLYGRGVVTQAQFAARLQQSQLPLDQLDQPTPAQAGRKPEDRANADRGNADRAEPSADDDPMRELAAGDVLIIDLPQSDGSSSESRVRVVDDGSIELPTLGRVPAAGLTPTQLAELIAARLADRPQLGQAGSSRIPTVRRVPMPAVPRLTWRSDTGKSQNGADEKVDLLLVIRARNDPKPAAKAMPSSAPADAR